jgi:hypothetical protein
LIQWVRDGVVHIQRSDLRVVKSAGPLLRCLTSGRAHNVRNR